ncbi:hypothetical protein CC2G_001752 [Coprinopsis cinerea AmutBmut pab1-1]|nr:hypothetical protein CC2G_001752 [Coprinopsis cinerea AmutBmut pab1-1]
MKYFIRLDNEYSELFSSLWGILAGDTSSFSPGLCNFFMSSFKPPVSPTDVLIHRQPINSLQQADDIAAFTRAFIKALQPTLDYIHLSWCANNFLQLNVGKTSHKGHVCL